MNMRSRTGAEVPTATPPTTSAATPTALAAVVSMAIVALMVASGAFAGSTAHGVPQGPLAAQAQQATVGPTLPFADNPDPALCGIPQPMGEGSTAVLDGHWQGRLLEADVILYDSHLRQAIHGALPTGTSVTVLLHQSNPSLDYYLVRGNANGSTVEGWVPAPFLRDIQTR